MKPRAKPEPVKKKVSTAPEPRAAAPVAQDHIEGVSEEEFDEEIESIGDGTEENDDMPPEVDEDDDEGYL